MADELQLVPLPAWRREKRLAEPPTMVPVGLDEHGPPLAELLRRGPAARKPAEWLAGEALGCLCPECSAPMTVRLWLLVADCWNCGTSIQLSPDDEMLAHRTAAAASTTTPPTAGSSATGNAQRDKTGQVSGPHWDQHKQRPARPKGADSSGSPTAPATAVPSSGGAPGDAAPSAAPRPHFPLAPAGRRGATAKGATGTTDVGDPAAVHPSGSRRRDAAHGPTQPVPQQPPPAPRSRSSTNWWNVAPAWLISMILHLVILLLLALLTMDANRPHPSITLSLDISPLDRLGSSRMPNDPLGDIHFDVPPPEPPSPRSRQEREWMARAEEEASQIRMDPDAEAPFLPDLVHVKAELRSDDVHRRSVASRDPRIRVELLRSQGGTTFTEAAVARGLRWMAQHQMDDGRWSLHQFHRAEACRGECRGRGSTRSDSAATSLCLLPFLGAGQTHLMGIYRQQVSKGLRWLIQHQDDNGDLRIDSDHSAGMYAHGQGTIVLCEAYALSRDEALREPAERAVRFLVEAQHPGGGWRYQPGQRGDTSVLGWQLMALQSARMAGLDVPDDCLELSGHFLDSVMSEGGALYSYLPGHPPTHVMTAEALLCRVYLGWRHDDGRLVDGVRALLEEFPPSRDQPNFYYWYYATQLLHHFGGKGWQAWNGRMRDVLVESQERHGHEAGSWTPEGPHHSEGGRIYTTALAVCTLEVYYRHAPIFRPIAD